MSEGGWGKPFSARKWHYFVGGRSLCGHYGWLGTSDTLEDDEPGRYDCATCSRKWQKRQEADDG